MTATGQRLMELVEAAGPALAQVDERQSAEPFLAGGWSRKQLLGHLIDSASNNHQRFVRAALEGSQAFPGYDQDGNVRVQGVQEASWPLLVNLWTSYNQFLAHVIAHLPESKSGTLCRIGSNEPVTLKFLADDYVAHLSHHLCQLGLTAN